MKINNEKGATGIDVATGLIIFIVASVAVVNLYYQIYVTSVTIKIHEVAVGCITEVFERIDLENYDTITEEKVGQMIDDANMNKYFNETKNKSHVEYSVSNYSDETGGFAEDIVKRINITVVYTISGNQVTFPINKLKVRE